MNRMKLLREKNIRSQGLEDLKITGTNQKDFQQGSSSEHRKVQDMAISHQSVDN